MGWKNTVLLQFVVCLLTIQKSALAQYYNSCPCQNAPIQQNMPFNYNRPVSASIPNQLSIANNMLRSANNGCPCNINTDPIYDDLRIIKSMTPEEKFVLRNALLEKLKMAASSLTSVTEKLSTVYSLASSSLDAVRSLNLPTAKVNVPIVNEVPYGAIRVARNLPITNLPVPNIPFARTPANFQVFGSDPVNYRNIAGVPFNTIARLPIDNLKKLPLGNIIGTPNYPMNNIKTRPINNVRLPYGNYLNPPMSDLERIPIYRPPCNLRVNNVPNIPCNNVPINRINLPITNLANLPVNRFINPPVSYLERPIQRYPYNWQTPINNVIYEQIPMASDFEKVVAKVPIVPMNSLADLPAYNGLPVIKVSESVYRLTPV